jgi:hypothetical protein
MVLTVLGMVAEMELGFIEERQAAGIATAKEKGVYRVRPVSLDHDQIRLLRSLGLGATAIGQTATVFSRNDLRDAQREPAFHQAACCLKPPHRAKDYKHVEDVPGYQGRCVISTARDKARTHCLPKGFIGG